jgi:membrane protein required for colicin V production
MTPFDYAILAIVGLSVIFAFWRGLIREVVSLLAWLVALWVAARFAVELAVWVPAAISTPSARYLTAFLCLFIGTIVVLELIAFLIARLLRAIGLGFIDRFLGAIFGLVRGALIAWVVVLLGGFTSYPQRDWWRDSVLAPPLQTAVLAARPLLPTELGKRIKYS